jgi:hypothetical protein
MPVNPSTITNPSPQTTSIYGRLNPAKLQSISVNQGQPVTINWTMKDPNGNAVNLSSLSSPTVTLAIREALTSSSIAASTQITGAITDAANGVVSAAVPKANVDYPGITIAEWGIFVGGVLQFSNVHYLVVNRGQFGAEINSGGPPTLAEIRLHLRDSAPEDNFLLDDIEFDDAEIAASIVRCVDQFNNMPPPISQVYNTSNFPFRYYWLEGIVGNLLTTAAHKYRRNQLAYSAAGIQVDDQNKEQQYLQAAMMHKQKWEQWATGAKVNLNMESGFGSLLSGYTYDQCYPNW